MSKVSVTASKSAPIVTVEMPFFEIGDGTHNLFSVREGVPLVEALNQALMFMHTANDLLNAVADDPAISGQLSWGVNYLNQMARATVVSVVSSLEAAERVDLDG